LKVQFLKDIKTAKIQEYNGQSLCIYEDKLDPPVFDNMEYMTLSEYRKKYSLIEPSFIVLVGLNNMIKPSNRCDFVFDYLSIATTNIPKISIDSAPFIGEPWRLFMHYLFTNTGKFLHPHSYAVETEWKKWFFRDLNQSFLSGDNVGNMITDTYSDLDYIKSEFNFITVDDSWYEDTKKKIFEKYSTDKMIINNLLKQCNKQYGVKIDFSFKRKRTNVPDLKIYRFVVEEIERRHAIYNAVVKKGRNYVS
jgi:hypothetical protein